MPMNSRSRSPFSLRAGIPPGLKRKMGGGKSIWKHILKWLEAGRWDNTYGTSSSSSIGSLSAWILSIAVECATSRCRLIDLGWNWTRLVMILNCGIAKRDSECNPCWINLKMIWEWLKEKEINVVAFLYHQRVDFNWLNQIYSGFSKQSFRIYSTDSIFFKCLAQTKLNAKQKSF